MRVKCYVFTIQLPSLNTIDILGDIKNVDIMFHQEEKSPTTGSLHLQGYIKFNTRVSFNNVKSMLPDGAHIEKAKAGVYKNYMYCSKIPTATGRFRFYSEIPVEPRSESRKRKNVGSDVCDDIKRGATCREIALAYPEYYIRHNRGIPELINLCAAVPKSRRVTVILLCGATNTGKSYWARQYADWHGLTLYSKMPQTESETQWFDGYSGQDVLLLDDFAKGQIPFRYLLQILDVYPLQSQRKGGFVQAVWNTVIITSNSVPYDWYPGIQIAPLLRRINETFEAEENKFCTDYMNFKELYQGQAPRPFEQKVVPLSQTETQELSFESDDDNIITLQCPHISQGTLSSDFISESEWDF